MTSVSSPSTQDARRASQDSGLKTQNSPLTIGFDATSAVHQGAGIGRYTRELLRALAQRDEDVAYRVFVCGPGRRAGSLPELGTRFHVRSVPFSDRMMNAVWHRAHVPLPVQAFTGRFDLFHSPDFTIPPTAGRPTLLTVHDLAFLRVPECAYPTLRTYLEKTVPRSVRRATHVIAVSESTRRDVIELLGVEQDRVTTVPEGVGPEFSPVADREGALALIRRAGIEPPYLLSVGTVEPRKNYVRLLEAFARLRKRGVPHRLVIAGRLGWLVEPFFARLDQLGLRSQLSLIQPDDQTLAALYGLADLCVFPSLYEGFGIPLLEAFACGAPVVCSNRSSFPEITGDAAETFDPEDAEAIAAAIDAVLGDANLARNLAAKGLCRAACFPWTSTAAATAEIYRHVAACA